MRTMIRDTPSSWSTVKGSVLAPIMFQLYFGYFLPVFFAYELATLIRSKHMLYITVSPVMNGSSDISLMFFLVGGAMSHKVEHKDSSKFAERTPWRCT
ncbi:hypothetical protein E2C01_024050 [Portunus trituberculatus]|uniref:Uncharacterized protein n=1 Tax=Portunus trituberculatus TaxID=210409 RepID=A0A5B7E9F7_PORTR|nr:hypothetical protein [Portunus trituberculatus]